MSNKTIWVLFSYRVPHETSTLRVRTWRILRRIGALALQQSFYVVPSTPETTRKLHQLRALIEAGQGQVIWLDVEQFAEQSTEQLTALFNEARQAEYEDFIESCRNFSKSSMSAETRESELKRLQKWFRKLQARDYFECSNQERAAKWLEKLCST
ncbi:Chromate resistance protein ChrB [Alicyclobacillus sp. SO9]|uniref:Chromate resistance protein ChrB n=1 Tax=Alicyclobacillus sp. SO9 TaxID=2665646 RepID=UPI0018E7A70B|nr:Chromate resistance protein ChrB [Alicyclobacillus sp. SO9]QQE77589.1 hypothetical protein GI364_16810 [Alicyclobacillus sp. SO9]